MGNFDTDAFPTERWASSDSLDDLPTAVASIDAALRSTFGLSTSAITKAFTIGDAGTVKVEVSLAIGTSGAMIDILDTIPSSPGANEDLKLATVDAMRAFFEAQ